MVVHLFPFVKKVVVPLDLESVCFVIKVVPLPRLLPSFYPFRFKSFTFHSAGANCLKIESMPTCPDPVRWPEQA